jgi:hypothetical protein
MVIKSSRYAGTALLWSLCPNLDRHATTDSVAAVTDFGNAALGPGVR